MKVSESSVIVIDSRWHKFQ